MTRSYGFGQVALQVKADEYGIPQKFIWQGRERLVKKLIESWQVHTNWWESGGAIRGCYYALIALSQLDAGETLMVIYQDLNTGEWWLTRVYD